MDKITLTRLSGLSRSADIGFLGLEAAREAAAFHAGFPVYRPTPLVNLKNLAAWMGVKGVLVKDESRRFGLNAFKALGGSYAIGRIAAQRLGIPFQNLDFEGLRSQEARVKLGEMTFVTATDGNHGRGVAWTARQLGQRSIVYMPAGSAPQRVQSIEAEGARVSVLSGNYDEAVRAAADLAREKGYVLVQDTAWEGYEDIPRWVMQGYLTLIHEAAQEMEEQSVRPSHVFVQAGVGSLAAAVAGYCANRWPGPEGPAVAVVEPTAVDCIRRSARQGKRVCIGGDYRTVMAGLACGEPNTLALQVLLDYAQNYLCADDGTAAYGMRILGNPLGEDERIVSGESGAAPLGTAARILREREYLRIRQRMGLGKDSVLLFISTEGDTDQEGYRRAVWECLGA